MKRWKGLFLIITVGLAVLAVGLLRTSGVSFENRGGPEIVNLWAGRTSSPGLTSIKWTHLSSRKGDVVAPGPREQTLALILDVDRNGLNDFVIGSRKMAPAMVWFRPNVSGWDMYLIDDSTLDIEAGGAFADIDKDGDMDVVAGEDYRGNRLYWWENPYPDYVPNRSWVRRIIKDSGANKHHDQEFGDFDGDGEMELAFWNQHAKKILLAEIPSDPKGTQPWPYTELFSGAGEGMAKADVDGDGRIDLLAGGRWFKHSGGGVFTAFTIDREQEDARIAVGDLKQGAGPEVVMVDGEKRGRLRWYEMTGEPTRPGAWVGHDLLGFDVERGHSLQVADFNGDGILDIFVGEMRLDGGNGDAKIWVFLGDGAGNFSKVEVASGYDVHEGKAGDLDGDGDVDILAKPYNWDMPRLDIWLNGKS